MAGLSTLNLLYKATQNLGQLKPINLQRSRRHNSGFTLIEMLVVVFIVATLAAISAPSWSAFVNRQRVNKVNDAVLSVLQQAQTEAKRTKKDYKVQFQTSSGVLQYDVYTGSSPNWKTLTQNMDIKPNQVVLFTTAGSNPITFDYLGTVKPTNNTNPTPLWVTVYLQTSPSVKKCIVLETILGSMRMDEGNYDSSTQRGCKIN